MDELYEAFLESCQKLGEEARAESSHGSGVETEQDKKDFFQYFGGLVDRNATLLNQMKKEK
jgi:hypothetical protein